jgi:hypothetical protein
MIETYTIDEVCKILEESKFTEADLAALSFTTEEFEELFESDEEGEGGQIVAAAMLSDRCPSFTLSLIQELEECSPRAPHARAREDI